MRRQALQRGGTRRRAAAAAHSSAPPTAPPRDLLDACRTHTSDLAGTRVSQATLFSASLLVGRRLFYPCFAHHISPFLAVTSSPREPPSGLGARKSERRSAGDDGLL